MLMLLLTTAVSAADLETDVGVDEGDTFKYEIDTISGEFDDTYTEDEAFEVELTELPGDDHIGEYKWTNGDDDGEVENNFSLVGLAHFVYISWDFFEETAEAAGYDVDNGDDQFEISLEMDLTGLGMGIYEYSTIYDKELGIVDEYYVKADMTDLGGEVSEFKIIRKAGFLGLPGFEIAWVCVPLLAMIPIVARFRKE